MKTKPKQVPLRISIELYEKIKANAEKEQRSFNNYLVNLLIPASLISKNNRHWRRWL